MARLRVVTFNIAHGRGLQPIQGLTSRRKIRRNLTAIADLLKQLDPDVVALQEIDEDSSWAGRFNHLEHLREELGYKHAVFGVNNRRSGLLRLNYGNAFLSRFPVTFSENTAFGRRKIGEKGFLFAEVDVGGARVPLVNMHLHYRLRSERLRQAQAVMDYLEARRQAHGREWALAPILCGDLNNSVDKKDATASLFRYFERHGSYTLHPQRARTFPSPFPRRTLDFIFLPPGCRQVLSLVVRSFLSDHRPVLVDFSFDAHAPGVAARHHP